MIFLDIETANVSWQSLDSDRRELWDNFAQGKYRNEIKAGWLIPDLWDSKASLHPEFGLIVCISYATDDGPVRSLFVDNDNPEVHLLDRLADGLRNNPMHYLCAHNGKGFDFHYIARRMVINKVELPQILNTQGLKPWELQFEDTQEMWGFGDMRRTVRLDVLCHCLGVPSPKDAMCGSEVPQAWRDGRIEEIVEYCEKDVVALRECFKILSNA